MSGSVTHRHVKKLRTCPSLLEHRTKVLSLDFVRPPASLFSENELKKLHTGAKKYWKKLLKASELWSRRTVGMEVRDWSKDYVTPVNWKKIKVFRLATFKMSCSRAGKPRGRPFEAKCHIGLPPFSLKLYWKRLLRIETHVDALCYIRIHLLRFYFQICISS